MSRRRKLPGYRWRYLAWKDDGEKVAGEYDGTESVCFDEMVIDDWFHIEQMNTRAWWMQVGGLHINVRIRPDGTTDVSGWADGGIIEVIGDGTSFRVVKP